jgi:hypothetical protein
MAQFTTKKKIVLITGALILTGGTAFAYWTQSGGGTGGATTGATTAVVVHQTNTVTGLFPGGPAQALSGNFDNPSTAGVTVGAVTATVTSTSAVGCDPAWYAITGTGAPASQVLTAGTAVGTWSGLNVSLLNNAANQDACKLATITISYTVAAGA